jgi:hypothetical protein
MSAFTPESDINPEWRAASVVCGLAAGSFVDAYLSVVSENGKAIHTVSGSSKNQLTFRRH